MGGTRKVRCPDGTVFESYREYLSSDRWAAKREEFKRSGRYWGCCVVCGSVESLQVHHMNYKTIGDEDINALTCLCTKCHRKFHNERKSKSAKKAARYAKKKKKSKKRERRVSLWCGKIDATSGKVKVFSAAEKEEYARQLQHAP